MLQPILANSHWNYFTILNIIWGELNQYLRNLYAFAILA